RQEGSEGGDRGGSGGGGGGGGARGCGVVSYFAANGGFEFRGGLSCAPPGLPPRRCPPRPRSGSASSAPPRRRSLQWKPASSTASSGGQPASCAATRLQPSS
ncbi:hypothetical protein JRQ81_000054, partial [Phrynocephalus forsythii]